MFTVHSKGFEHQRGFNAVIVGCKSCDQQPHDAGSTPLQRAVTQSPLFSCAAGCIRQCLLIDILAAAVLDEVLARCSFTVHHLVTPMVSSRGSRAFLTTICTLAIATFLEPCLAGEYIQKTTSSTPGYKLLPGVLSVPAPISVVPDQGFEGIDGFWNTFSLRIGSTRRRIRVFISTASQQVWAINPQACISNQTNEITGVTQVDVLSLECEKSRGFLFNTTESQTWAEQGFYQLWLGRNRDLYGNGLYGFDSVGLGLLGELGPTVQNTTIATLISSSFWLGHFGLHYKSTNFSSYEDAEPSYLTSLFEDMYIPSLSFGYTAGARYCTLSIERANAWGFTKTHR